MKAIIDYWIETNISTDQTRILFNGSWYEILTDQEGDFYFMSSEGNVIYFEVVTD